MTTTQFCNIGQQRLARDFWDLPLQCALCHPAGRQESRKDSKFIVALSGQLARMKQRDRNLLLHLAQKMAGQKYLKTLGRS